MKNPAQEITVLIILHMTFFKNNPIQLDKGVTRHLITTKQAVSLALNRSPIHSSFRHSVAPPKNVVFDFKVSLFFSHIFGYIHTVFLFIALGHSCINPFIYFWTDARVRWGFLDLFGSIPGVKNCFPNISWESPLTR